jgi:hypothetical protein
MPLRVDKLGINAQDITPEKVVVVEGAPFNLGGMLIEADRQYLKALKVSDPEEFSLIFGAHDDPLRYGPDAVKSFFDNSGGIGELEIQTLTGYDTGGDVVDSTIAFREVPDTGADLNAYKIQPAYLDNLQYGTGGNKIGTKVTQGDRFITKAAGVCPATGQSYAELDSIAGILVGDLVLFKTNSGSSPVYKKVTQIEQATRRVYWTGDFEVSGASGETLAVDDDITVPGIRVQTYVKLANGIDKEVDIALGQRICSTEIEVTDHYVNNVHNANTHIQVTEQSGSSLGDRLPVSDSGIVYPTNGSDGTAVNTVEAQDYFLKSFDNLPIRFLANPETVSTDMQKALVTYSLGRDDKPFVLVNIPLNRTKEQLITIGQSFQRPGIVPAVIDANWLTNPDPFATSPQAPRREIPNVGASMAAWIKAIDQLGIHQVAAAPQIVLNAAGVVGNDFQGEKGDKDRTDIARAGVNLIQSIPGKGIKIANFFTPSTDDRYIFAQSQLMANYFKASIKASLGNAEVEMAPCTLERIEDDGVAIFDFMQKIWKYGTTGRVRLGETFGQTKDDQGRPTNFSDHVQIIANTTNNSKESISAGARNIRVLFTFASSTIEVNVNVGVQA